jgi:hypothetical protein
MAEHVEAVYGEAAGLPVAGRPHQPYPKMSASTASATQWGA